MDFMLSIPCPKEPNSGSSRPIYALFKDMVLNKTAMEKIEPQEDHLRLERFEPGQQVRFQGKPYILQRRTTLASGEAAVVLQGEKEQFVIGASKFLAGIS